MTISLKHAFQSTKPDGADTSLVRPSDWNADHVLTMDSARLLGRASAGNGTAEEIAVSPARALAGGRLVLGHESPKDCCVIFSDMLDFNITRFMAGSFGTGSSSSQVLNAGQNLSSLGLWQCATGSATNGAACVLWPTTNSAANQAILFGSYPWTFETSLSIPVASNATDDFVVRAGFTEDPLANGTDAAHFLYDYTTYGDHNWRAVTRSNGTATIANTGVAANVAGFQVLRVEVNAAGTQADFYINDTLAATITTNIPTGAARSTGLGAGIAKRAGTTSRAILVDYILAVATFPNGRPVS